MNMRIFSLFLAILITSFCFSFSSHASLFEELDTVRQQEVLKKLKDHMPNMIADKKLNKYAKYMADNVPKFATNLGALSGGNYTPIITQSLTLGGDALADYFAGTLPDGLGKDTFSYLYGKTGSARNIGLAMMDERNTWGDVRDVVWNEIKTSLQSDLNKFAEEAAKDSFNWVVGGNKVLGFSAADLYVMAIKAEMIFIDVETRRYKENTFHDIYTPYYKARQKGENSFSAWQIATFNKNSNTSGSKAFFALGDMPDREIQKLFESCYTSTYYNDNLYQFMKYSLDTNITKSKTDLADNMHKPGQKFRNDINGFYDKVREKLNELVGEEIEELTKKRDEEIENDEELKKRYEAAIEKAGILLDKIEIDDERRQPACEGFTKQQQAKNDAVDIAYKSERAIKKLETILKNLEQCPEINSESQGIRNDLDTLKNLLKKSKQRWSQPSQDVTNVCVEAGRVDDSENQGEARQALNKTINLAKSAERMAEETLTLETEIEKKFGALSTRILSFNKKFKGANNSVKENLETKMLEAKELTNSLTKLKEAEKQFNDAVKRMESDRTKAVNLSLSIDKNYIEINDILNDGTVADTVQSGGLFSGSDNISGALKWGSKAQDILSTARERQQHLLECDEEIQERVVKERERLRGTLSLGSTVRELFPDYFGSSNQTANSDDNQDEWPGFDIRGTEKRYQLTSAKCNYTKNAADSIEMLKNLSALQKGQIGTKRVFTLQKKLKMCVGGALAFFDKKYLNKEKQAEEKEAPDRQSRIRDAEEICKKQLPGSLPVLDKHGYFVPTNNNTSNYCQCQDGSIEYNQKCVPCTDLKQRFDNAVRTKRTDNAEEILDNSFHCDWVRNREDAVGLTEEELCPDRNSVYLSDENNNAQCVSCNELEADFDAALKNNETDYAETLLSLAEKCKWTKRAADRIDEEKARQDCEQTLPGSVVVRSGGQNTCRCPANTVKLSGEENQNVCVSCEALNEDFNSTVAQGDLGYAETILDLADTCIWVPGGRKKLDSIATCPEGTVKLSDDSGKNQCVSCQTLYQDFDSTVDQGDFEYAETLLDLAAGCGWVAGGKVRLSNARKCPENMVKLSDDNSQNQCVPCETLYSDYTVAKGQGDTGYAASLLDLASDCSWTDKLNQQVRNEQLQAELNRKCKEQMPGSHAVINGDRYNCYCDDGMIELTYNNGNKSCQSCQQIGEMVNAALKQNNVNTVKGLIRGAKHCSWHDQAVGIVTGMENSSQPPRQPTQPSQQPHNPLTGDWNVSLTDLDPYKHQSYNMDGSKGNKYNIDVSGKLMMRIIQSGSQLRGTISGEGGSFPLNGRVSGNNVRINCNGDPLPNLKINYNNMTMSGIDYDKRGKPSTRYYVVKRR